MQPYISSASFVLQHFHPIARLEVKENPPLCPMNGQKDKNKNLRSNFLVKERFTVHINILLVSQKKILVIPKLQLKSVLAYAQPLPQKGASVIYR